jgi:hypothetical protein
MNYYLFLAAAFGVGCGVAIAAALLTYRHSSPPAAEATDAQRQDALERFKIWTEFWKYFLVSFALVLITTLLGQILKQRELDLQKSKQASELALEKSKQESELALEKEKQASRSLMDENTNLGSFLDKAMVDSADQQFRFASYFSHLVRDPDARHRWEDYAEFIQKTKQATQQLDAEARRVTAELNDPKLPEEQRTKLEKQRNEVESKLDLNIAVLQAPSGGRAEPMWSVYGEQNKASKNWSQRHFDVQGGSKLSVPKPNDTVTAVNNVYIRSSAPEWNDQMQDLKVGPIIGTIKPGDRALVLEVLDTNSPNDANAYYFIGCYVCRRNEAV